MARIHIEDLPPDSDLTPEELERIFGAGRPSFRPGLEALENREMYAANLGTALPAGLLPTVNPAQGQALMRTLTPANQVQMGGMGVTAASNVQGATAVTGPNAALDQALWGSIGTGALAAIRSIGALPMEGAGHGGAGPTALHSNPVANQNQPFMGPRLKQQITGVVHPLAPNQAAAKEQLKTLIDRYFSQNDGYLCKGGTWKDPRTGKEVETLRIQRPENNYDTVSEGIGYGMLMAVNSDRPDAKKIFDGLWAYGRKNFNTNGLMKWQINQQGTPMSDGAASDADEDMAMALILAYKRWGDGSYYKEDAKDLIGNILKYEVDPNTHSFMGGDWWAGAQNGLQVNPSYLAPAYYKVFQEFTGVAAWGQVADQSYKLLDIAVKAGGNTGLVPDWMTPEGKQVLTPEGKQVPDRPYVYGHDAIRTPWRIGLDAAWYGDQRAISYLTKINAFYKKVGIPNIVSQYKLDGTPMNKDHDAQAISMAATSAMVDPDPGYRTQFWEAMKNANFNHYWGYYNQALLIQSTLLTGGLMEKPVFEKPVV